MAEHNDRPTAVLDRPVAPVGSASPAPAARRGTSAPHPRTRAAGLVGPARDEQLSAPAAASQDASPNGATGTARSKQPMDPDVRMMLWVMLFFVVLALGAGAAVGLAVYATG